jgi:hypothetical protein
MRLKRLTVPLFCVPLSVLLLAGCGRSPQAAPQGDPGQSSLGEIWEIYNGYTLQHHKPPAQIADVRTMKVPYPRGYADMADGRFIVRFGTPLEPAGKVLAYAKDAPSQGGLVLMNDGSTKSMTADEVQAAIK